MLSFIIPTLNEHQTIERTLRCLSGYSGDHEIIVSDGNSSDDTVEICRRFTDRIVVHDEPRRQTIAEARNAGAAAARGNHLVFVDADDCVGASICDVSYYGVLLASISIVLSDATPSEVADGGGLLVCGVLRRGRGRTDAARVHPSRTDQFSLVRVTARSWSPARIAARDGRT